MLCFCPSQHFQTFRAPGSSCAVQRADVFLSWLAQSPAASTRSTWTLRSSLSMRPPSMDCDLLGRRGSSPWLRDGYENLKACWFQFKGSKGKMQKKVWVENLTGHAVMACFGGFLGAPNVCPATGFGFFIGPGGSGDGVRSFLFLIMLGPAPKHMDTTWVTSTTATYCNKYVFF